MAYKSSDKALMKISTHTRATFCPNSIVHCYSRLTSLRKRARWGMLIFILRAFSGALLGSRVYGEKGEESQEDEKEAEKSEAQVQVETQAET